MEISVGEYGRLMFEIMAQSPFRCSDSHWERIREKAEPLVRQLISLNKEISCYEIVGYQDEQGKEIKSKKQRIKEAQEKLWRVKDFEDLMAGDRVFHYGGGFEHILGDYNEPVKIEFIKYGSVYLENYDNLFRIRPTDTWITILKVPDNWDNMVDVYSSQDYWLEQANILGI